LQPTDAPLRDLAVAAHIRAASRARSDAEFISKLGGTLQETDETTLWLELLHEECEVAVDESLPIEAEASEPITIMTTMINKTKTRKTES
jgi:four helix bundle protein